MKIRLIWDKPFLKLFKKWSKKHPELIEKFQFKLSLFTEDPFHPSLRTHQLSGNLKDYWSLSITYEYRLIFKFISDNEVLLIEIGTHDEVY